MKKSKYVLALVLGLMLSACLCLVACSSEEGGNVSSADVANDAGVANGTDVASDIEPASPQTPAVADDAVYTLSHYEILAYEGGTRSIDFEYDAAGVLTGATRHYPDGGYRITTYADFDEHGNSALNTYTEYDANGNEIETVSYTQGFFYDDQGRLTQVDDDDGVSTYYSYYDNGVLSESTNSQGYENYFDEKGRKTYYDGGFANRERGALSFAYDEDAEGHVTGWTASFANGESYYFTCDTDDAGNIIAVYDPNGTQIVAAEYARIENPCDAVKTYAYTRTGTFIVVDAVEEYLGI